jgi:hypothetical protein
MDRTDLVGDIVSHWHKYGERRRTVTFAVNVPHSIHICEEFNRSGVKAEHIDGSTLKSDRDAALARLASGDTRVITNCMVLKRATSATHTARLSRYKTLPLLECTECGCIRVAGQPCASCGFLPKRSSEAIVFAEGDLAFVDRHKRAAQPTSDPHEQLRCHAMLLSIADERGYKSGWAAHKFKEKFGFWPPRMPLPTIKASPECLSWVRSRNIAWVKAREKAGAA